MFNQSLKPRTLHYRNRTTSMEARRPYIHKYIPSSCLIYNLYGYIATKGGTIGCTDASTSTPRTVRKSAPERDVVGIVHGMQVFTCEWVNADEREKAGRLGLRRQDLHVGKSATVAPCTTPQQHIAPRTESAYTFREYIYVCMYVARRGWDHRCLAPRAPPSRWRVRIRVYIREL